MGCGSSSPAGGKNATPESAMGHVARGWETMLLAQGDQMDVPTKPGNLEISRAQLDTSHHINLGEGLFGICYETRVRHLAGQHTADGLVTVVVKRLNPDVCKTVRTAFLNEVQHMKAVSHPNIFKLLGVITADDPMIMCLEYFAFGNLKQFLQTQRTAQQLTTASMFAFARNVASGLDYLHSRGVVHCDVAARNCLVNEDLVVKIGDYGLSTTLFTGDYFLTSKHGYLPVRWMAPEAFPDSSNTLPSPTTAADVWSFGVLLLEIFTYSALPYSNLSNSQVQSHVQAGNQPTIPEEIATTHNLQTLVHSCFTRAAAARPNTNSVISELDARIAEAGGFDPSISRGSSRTSMLSANAVANSYVMIGDQQPMTHVNGPETVIEEQEDDLDDVSVEESVPASDPSTTLPAPVSVAVPPVDVQAVAAAEEVVSPMNVEPTYTEDAFNNPGPEVADNGDTYDTTDIHAPPADDLYAAADTHEENEPLGDDNYEVPQDTLKRGGVQAKFYQQPDETSGTEPTLPYMAMEDPSTQLKKRQSFRSLETFKQASNPEFALEAATGRSLVVELDRANIDLGKVLGKGAFGEVRLGTITTLEGKQMKCACKTLRPGAVADDEDALLAEAQLVSRFKNENVVNCYGQVTRGEPSMIVFELMENGALFNWLGEHGSTASLKDKLKMGIDIARGMCYLSEQGYVHRDLATRNVLLGEELQCKISDFGLSRDLEDEMYYESDGGMVPVRWTPPEAFKFRKFSTKSDVWSYGITLYEIFTNAELPYGKNWSNLNVMVEVERGFRLKAPKGCPRAIYKLMMASWNPHRRGRPSFDQLEDQMVLAYDMLFPADEEDVAPAVEYECQDLLTLFVGVPVPDEEHLDDDDGDQYLKPGKLLLTRNDDLFQYSADGTTAVLKSSMQVARQDSFAGVVSDPQASAFKRDGSFRKQQELGGDEATAAVEYNSNRAVADVLKIARFVFRWCCSRVHISLSFSKDNARLSASWKRKASLEL
eukprot:m.155798 g.155798  ORF g.155798 m.155798 type:complete len:994 (+) comp16425_c0_seq6:141-3122(+)